MKTKQLIFSMGVLIFLFNLNVVAQEIPSPEQALQNFNINAAGIKQLEEGEIVSYEVSETSKKELAVGLAMIIPASLSEIVNYINEGHLNINEVDLISSMPLLEKADIRSFKEFGFTAQQMKEAKSFLKAEPGELFNLSQRELDNLRSLQGKLKNSDDTRILKLANQKYREFLLNRYTTYREKGLAGIDSYIRDEGLTDPGKELRTDALNSKAWAQYFPELQQTWLNYPAALPENTSEEFLWMNRMVEDRPTAILTHRIIASNEVGGILLSRQFYVGHSYNSSHVVAGGLPYKNGTLVFYSVRSSTDQVDGPGSKLKHFFGRTKLKKEMIDKLRNINADLK